MKPRVIKADNGGPFTLDGSRAFLVGRQQVAVVDPGPKVESHFRALVVALEGASEVRLLLTHGHRDHAEVAPRLAERLKAPVMGPESALRTVGTSAPTELLKEGARVPTDQGELVAVEVPGHTRDHLAFHWTEADALFVGDLLLGRGNTTWIGEYPGCVGDYLRSLERVEALGVGTLYPGHGPPISGVAEAVDRFRRHRLARVEEVREARLRNPDLSSEQLARLIYGKELTPALLKAARASVEATLAHLGQT